MTTTDNWGLDAPPEPKRHACPDCGEMFKTPQAVGHHRRHDHGYVSPNLAAKRAKEGKTPKAKPEPKRPDLRAVLLDALATQVPFVPTNAVGMIEQWVSVTADMVDELRVTK